jgi:chemotaxis protein MotB
LDALRGTLENENENLENELAQLQSNLGDQSTEAERQAALLAMANDELAAQEALSAESQRQVALLNEQITQLRTQVGNLQSLLNIAEEADREAQVQIETLGAQLNTALARVVSEERQRRALEEAERIRLEAEAVRLAEEAERLAAEAENLARFKSDFFGELREILEGQDRIRIEGDRFIFNSEVLFEPGSATLAEAGKVEIANIADILRSIAEDIPAGIDWVIRVDGHTDNIPVGVNAQFEDNWELSQARALSVVRFMSEDLGIDPRRLAANGFGEFQPLNPLDSPEARAQNRRIELKLTER